MMNISTAIGQRSAIGKLLDMLVKHGTMPYIPIPKLITDAQDELAVNEILINAQAARVAELEALLKQFVDNFEPCDTCAGTGTYQEDACPNCGGTAIQIKSRGVLLSELYPDAKKLLGKK